MSKLTGNQEFNGEVYVKDIGGYDGTNPSQSQSLKDVIENCAKDINEPKPDQEFVFRKTPNTIKAKALTLDKIKGKTLAWNQLAESVSLYDVTYGTKSVVSTDEVYLTPDGASNNCGIYMYNRGPISGHKYYVSAFVKIATAGTYEFLFCDWTLGRIVADIPANVYTQVHGVLDAGESINYTSFSKRLDATAYNARDLEIIDLTRIYGSEIDGMTDDEILAKFESEFPGYHAYNPGTLLSNDAESLETVGFNQWDEEWESGTLNTTTGEKVATATMIRSKNYISVLPSTNYYVKGNLVVCFYDAEGTYIGFEGDAHDAIITTPDGCYKILFRVSSDYGTTYNHDICINISDPSRNGQYEPYRKSILPLNLNKIRVISPNIWDEEWELGVYDTDTGAKADYALTQIRCKNLIPIQPSTTYYKKSPEPGVYWNLYYDANKNYLGYSAAPYNTEFTTPANAYYMAIYTENGYGTTYNHDICINKSDPGFNGKYFPHGILTITTGLNGVGGSYDSVEKGMLHKRRAMVNLEDLVWGETGTGYYAGITNLGAKIPAEDSGIINIIAQKYAVSGPVNGGIPASPETLALNPNVQIYASTAQPPTGFLDYELANEEIYELAEPLPTSMPAGTTEARISPNADGLSAPMVADITYGMGATEYAETAGVALYATNTSWSAGNGNNSVVLKGSNGKAFGENSVVEGIDTVAYNRAEHAEGEGNVSNTGSTAETNTRHSVGIGNDQNRKNAFEIMQNGDAYLYGIGGYDGTNPSQAQSVKVVIDGLETKLDGVETLLASI